MPAEPFALILTLTGVFGLVWGSFLNVCIFRVARDLSVVAPRSFCPECEQFIAWYDNIPVLSYLALRGRCRHCSHGISLRYPLVELLTASLLVAVVAKYGVTLPAFKWAALETLSVVLFCTDLELRILPDEFTLGGLALGLLLASIVPVHGILLGLLLPGANWRWRSLLNSAIGAALALSFWTFAAAYRRLRKLEFDLLGLGDVKLMALLGAFFGLEDSVPVLLWATLTGLLVGLARLLLKGRTEWRYELPFGSFLCASAALAALLPSHRF